MPSQVTNYKCPSCTGPLHFSSATGRLECEYCGSFFTVEEMERRYAQQEQQAAQASQAAEERRAAGKEDEGENWGVSEGMRAYNCPSCGAQLMCDANTAATSCPYCGNPTIVPGQFSGARKPDYVIPFKYDKQAAIDALKKHYEKKPLLPRVFKTQNHLEEIQGVYVPFWLFDQDGDADMTFEATRSHTTRQGEWRVTRTDHFSIRREGTVSFARIPVDASTKMPDENMDSIEPFHYEELKPFSTAYLPGFLADRYDVTAEDSSPRAARRCQTSCESAIRETVMGYETCVPTSSNVNVQNTDVKYALLPVWLLHTKWNGQDFLFSMNGQTGKLTGDLPVSMGRFLGFFFAIFAPLAAIASLILFL